MSEKKIKFGVFGVGRGMSLAKNLMLCNAELVAVCENQPSRIEKACPKIPDGVKIYDNFDEFIEHKGLDAVVLANFFHEHAPYAIKCLERGIHVYSECTSNSTMAEGVALVRAFEKSNAIYMLAENYPNMKFNREMRRIRDTGTLGSLLFAEGEYNHPGDPFNIEFKKTYTYFPEHWRNFLPKTYYITHSLGPVMYVSGAVPKRVTAFSIYRPTDKPIPTASYNGDNTSIIMTQNDDGSVFRVTGNAAFGAHGNSYRFCYTKGQMENLRGMDGQVMLRYNSWTLPEGCEEKKLYQPEWNDPDEDLIEGSGHGGGDYITARIFVNAIKEGKQPEYPFDIYSATTMASVAILAHRSVLNGGQPYDIPDFRLEADKAKYENDDLTPFFGPNGEAPTIPCCSHPEHKPTEEQVELYKKLVMN